MKTNRELAQEMLDKGLHLIPPHMHEGVQRYVMDGVPMGNFGTAVFSNNFMRTCRAADDINRAALFNWAQFLYSYVPIGCHGSLADVEHWIDNGGVHD